MLRIIRSPVPGVLNDRAALPAEAAEFLAGIERQPQRSWWIVPTSRRRRALQRAWLQSAERGAALLPRFHTLESFVAQVLEYSPKQLPQIGGPERLLRLARAWQEITGRTAGPGLVRQLDRFVRDWQACMLPQAAPSGGGDLFESLVQRYLDDLSQDRRTDRLGSVGQVTAELADPKSWPSRLLAQQIKFMLFDGFHRLERAELELIAALSQRVQVLLWLVGSPGQIAWKTLESATSLLVKNGCDASVKDCVPDPSSPLAKLGRTLFPIAPVPGAKVDPVLRLVKLQAPTPRAELEAVARQIKADYRTAQPSARPLRLSDIAVVIPGPVYDPLVREVFPRAGLEFNLAGRALLLSTSRPARVLTAALRLIRGQWRHDLLLDFLNQPLVKRCLEESHRLYDLFEHRPRARRRLDHATWLDCWNQLLARQREAVRRWRSGELDLPERVVLTREEYVEKQTALADGLEKLIASIAAVLQPVAVIDQLSDRRSPTPAPLRELVQTCGQLLGALRIDRWLSPPRLLEGSAAAPAVLWVEYEKDQQAYAKLLGVLETLAALSEARLPQTSQGQPDALAALQLALDSETYQIKTEDDAGVQVFELREIRGLRFRHVYVLGLLDGQIPSLPEEGALAGRRRRTPALNEQLQQKEAEECYLFSQVFEAAEELLVLSRPTLEEDRPALPSRFLSAVEERVPLPALEPAQRAVSAREGARLLGRLAAKGAAPEAASGLERVWDDLQVWRSRERWPHNIGVDAPALLRLLFPEQRAFSPSELETYAACPFRYYGARVLGLEEREPDRTRLHYGSLVHRVLQTLYVEERQRFGLDHQPLPAVQERQFLRLVELFEAEWRQLADGLLPPDLRTLFACDGGVLQLFLEAIALVEKDYGNLLVEFVLQDAEGRPILLGSDRGNRTVFLSGKIDRVDVHRTQLALAVITDYKTGRAMLAKERATKLADGRLLQLPLYGSALKVVRPDLEVVGGAYVHLSERPQATAPSARQAIAAVGALLTDDRAPQVPFDAEAARLKALDMVGAIRTGRFPLTEHANGQDFPECTWFCPLRHACRHPAGYQGRFGF